MNRQISQAVILAGGLGTRLKPFTDTNPKPMYPIKGKPYLEYLIEQVYSFGIQDIVILLGYLPEKIQEYFGDGHKWNVHITYDITPVDYDTGSRLKHAESLIRDEFLLMYCDNYCPIDFQQAFLQYKKNKPLIQISMYTNKDQYTKNNLKVDQTGKVLVYDKKRLTPNLQGVDIGYAIINKQVFEMLPNENCNFEGAIYSKLVEEGKLDAYITEHRYYSIGSYQRLKLTEAFFEERKVIFLDRDGTINKRALKADYIKTPEAFEWLDGAKQAIKKLNDKGYLIFLVTNQPGIARGMMDERALEAIHDKMQKELTEVGAHIDKIYYCPHGWDENCDCRKPKAGMLYQAQKEYSLNLTKCILVGDDERDITAGNAAGCKCYMVDEEKSLLDIVNSLED